MSSTMSTENSTTYSFVPRIGSYENRKFGAVRNVILRRTLRENLQDVGLHKHGKRLYDVPLAGSSRKEKTTTHCKVIH